MKCNAANKPAQPNPDYFHYVNGQDLAMYATVAPKSACSVPYWCNPISAYNSAPPTGYISLSTDLLSGKLPIAAKYSLGLIVRDLQSGITRDPSYYGTVLQVEGKSIMYNPAVMTGSLSAVPADQFAPPAAASTSTTAQGTATTPVPASGSATPTGTPGGTTAQGIVTAAEDIAQGHPLAVAGGLLLMLFGVATLAALK